MNTTIKSYCDEIIKSSQFVVFSKPSCPDCVSLKLYFDSLQGVSYRVVMINHECNELENSEYDMFDLVDYMKNIYGINKYPICFHEGNYVSMDDVKKLTTLSFKHDDIDNI